MTRNKILIADDEDSMRDIEEITLEENFPQFEVESFKDGTSLEDRLKRGVEMTEMLKGRLTTVIRELSSLTLQCQTKECL